MSKLKKVIDFEALEEELNDALKADELYRLQNDAKIRAIEQRVPTYDHFCDMVKAAHLKPLERSEMQTKPQVSWNHCYVQKDQNSESLRQNKEFHCPLENKIANSIVNYPNTSIEFFSIWKDLNGNFMKKFQYLFHLRDCLKNKFFKSEVPPEFLEELSFVLLDICMEDLISSILDILSRISECNRFILAVAMLSEQGKSNLKIIFEKLNSFKSENTENEQVISNLMSKYCIS